MLQQGAAVPIRIDPRTGKVRVLIIQTLSKPREWIVPKGRVDFGETSAAAAARETHEESGWRGQLGPFLGTFHDAKKNASVDVFVLFVKDDQSQDAQFEERGERKQRWVSLKKAIGKKDKKDKQDKKDKGKGKETAAAAEQQPGSEEDENQPLVQRPFVLEALKALRALLKQGIQWPQDWQITTA